MKQKLVLETQRLAESPFVDHLSVEEEDIEIMEEKLDDEAPWEVAFERGVELADDEMIDSWDEEEWE